jgi:hypothetical protein
MPPEYTRVSRKSREGCRISGGGAGAARNSLQSVVARRLIQHETMLRTRLVLLTIVAALLAPVVAPCLASTTSGHAAMACCHKQEPASPTLRECCVPAGRAPTVPAPAGQVARIAPAPVAMFVPEPPLASIHLRADDSTRVLAVQPHLRFSVLLI